MCRDGSGYAMPSSTTPTSARSPRASRRSGRPFRACSRRADVRERSISTAHRRERASSSTASASPDEALRAAHTTCARGPIVDQAALSSRRWRSGQTCRAPVVDGPTTPSLGRAGQPASLRLARTSHCHARTTPPTTVESATRVSKIACRKHTCGACRVKSRWAASVLMNKD